MQIKCLKCNSIIEGDKKGTLIYCACKSCYIDEVKEYVRIGGNKNDFIILDDSKYIFLDIDGVLNTQKFLEGKLFNYDTIDEDDFDSFAKNFVNTHIDFKSLNLLKDFSEEEKARIVIISSWTHSFYWDYIEKELKEKGLNIVGVTNDLQDNLPNWLEKYDRGLGIHRYLDKYNIIDYVIIDDETKEYDEELLKHLVQTDYLEKGFDEEAKDKASEILNGFSRIRK